VAGFIDVNRDGADEVLATSMGPDNIMYLHTISARNGSILSSTPGVTEFAYEGRTTLSAVDLNRDGILDVATSSSHLMGNNLMERTTRVLTWVGGQYEPFGIGCRGSFGILQLSGQGTPAVGQPFLVTLGNVAPLWGGVLFLGASNTHWGGLRLPVPLDLIGMPGCTLYVSTDAGIGFLPISTTCTVPVPIPSDPVFLHSRFFNQAAQLDLRANPFGLSASNAAAAVVGT